MPPRRANLKAFANSYALRRNLTEAESKLWSVLRAHQLENIHFRRQHAVGPYIVDFCAPGQKLVIEIDGGQHLEHQQYDAERTAFLAEKGYRVLRFWNHEVIDNLDAVVQVICQAMIAR